eukprot:8577161-Alexandrium_andersonii.AAC.1
MTSATTLARPTTAGKPERRAGPRVGVSSAGSHARPTARAACTARPRLQRTAATFHLIDPRRGVG